MAAVPRVLVAVLPGAAALREVAAASQPEPVVVGDAAGAQGSQGTPLAAEAASAVPRETPDVAAWVGAAGGRAVAEKFVSLTNSAVDRPHVEVAETS